MLVEHTSKNKRIINAVILSSFPSAGENYGDCFNGRHLNSTGQRQISQTVYSVYVLTSFGVDRTFLTVLVDAYETEKLADGTERTVLRFSKNIAPLQIAVFPLKKNEPRIVAQAKEIVKTLRSSFTVAYDDTAAIGKLYRRQDEIGTPYCITVDFDTVEKDQKVTVRNRDTMEQVRIAVADLSAYFDKEFRQEF